MQSNFQGRSRQKNFNDRYESNNNYYSENEKHDYYNDPEDEVDESRSVRVLPDANLTISVFNDYRDSRYRGNRGILKSNSYRNDQYFNDNYDRNSNYSRRGFGNYGGERGKSRGFTHGNHSNDFDYKNDKNQRGYRGRPSSGTYENYSDNNQDRNYSGKELPENFDNNEDSRSHGQGYNDRRNMTYNKQSSDDKDNARSKNDRSKPYENSHDDRAERDYHSKQSSENDNKEFDNVRDLNSRDKQSSENYDQGNNYNQDRRSYQDNNQSRPFVYNDRNFRGRGRSSYDRPRRSQEWRGGRGRARHFPNNNDRVDNVVGCDSKVNADDGTHWQENDDKFVNSSESEVHKNDDVNSSERGEKHSDNGQDKRCPKQ